jgi:hypothetical protein
VLREIREEVDQECGDLTTAPTRPASDPPVDPAGRRHIAEYSREELVRLVRWFEEGDAEPTGSELLRAVRDHLNYRSNVERASLAIADAIVEVERDRADRRLLAASRRQG